MKAIQALNAAMSSGGAPAKTLALAHLPPFGKTSPSISTSVRLRR
jgi:hypothetical protein